MARGVMLVWMMSLLGVTSTLSYPHPTECGDNSQYICDPGRILNTTQVRKLDGIVDSLKETTKCLCEHKENCHPGTKHLVLVAVVPAFSVDYKHTGNPQENVKAFAEKLYINWMTDNSKCKMVLVIAYDATNKVVGYNMNKFGKKVLRHLDDRIQTATEEFFKHGKTFEGLQLIINYCKHALYRGIPVHEFSLWTALGLPIVVSIPIIFFCSLCWICILTCRT